MDILRTITVTTRKYWHMDDEDLKVKIVEALRRTANILEEMEDVKVPDTLTLEIHTESACEACAHYNDPGQLYTCLTCDGAGKGFKPHGHTS